MPRSRGVRETLIALLALPVLLLVGVQVGQQLRGDPAAPVTGEPAAASPPASSPASAAPQRAAPAPPPANPAATPVVTTPRTPAARPPAARPPEARPPIEPVPTTGAAAPAPPPLALARGLAGAQVRQWQQRMAQRGWRIAVDGIYGPRSAAVARQFQAEKGLAVDGLVGPQTWRAAWRLPVTP